MRLMSTLTRLGLIFLAGAMITVLGTAELWDQEPDNEVTTLDLPTQCLTIGLYHCSFWVFSWLWR